jgi:hypothetical protein
MIMKQKIKQLKITLNGKRMAGGMLLEVVLAIAVFAFGMLALVQLQGNLTRSSADANTRTVATNIAEEIVENIRGFTQVDPVVDPNEWGYLELVGNALNTTVTRGGMDYAVSAEISDFWWDKDNETFIKNAATDPPTVPEGVGGLAYASFKLLKIDVAWNTSQDFYVDDDNTAVLGPGNITIYEIIPNSPPSLGAKIAANPNAAGNAPAAEHSPGDKPDIVALDLGGNVAKESTTPVPDIIRSGRLTETSFDVVTYNSATNVFVRREEFVTVGCECILHTDGDGGGFRPVVWNGVDYTAGEFVNKNYGESSNNQQSVFCDVCCRDHHDGGSGETDTNETKKQVYNPWSGADGSQDHKHYRRTGNGQLVKAGNGDEYAEACRLVRKDGFFRVAQDFNQEGFFGIPHDYLDNDFEVGEYSNYVNDAVDDFYKKNPSPMKQPGDDPLIQFTNPATGLKDRKLPAMVPETATNLPILVPPYSEEQQLRSRGIYNDYLSDETKAKITDCQDDISRCVLPGFNPLVGLLAYYPYFDVQLTSLGTWREVIPNIPVHVTDEVIESDNSHSKGLAMKMTDEGNSSTIKIEFLQGNVGIAAVDPIVPPPAMAAAVPTASGPRELFIQTTGSPTDYVGIEVTGDFLASSNKIRTRDIEIRFGETQCGRTATGYMCIIPTDDQGNILTSNPTLSVSDISGNNQTFYACSTILGPGIVELDGWTTFTFLNWTTGEVGDGPADIVIQETVCG